MADDDTEPTGEPTGKSEKAKKRTYLIIGIGAVGLLIAYLTLRAIANKNSTTTGTTATATTVTPGAAVGSGTSTSRINTVLATQSRQLTGIDHELSAILASNTALQQEIVTQAAQINTLKTKIRAGSGTTGGHGPGSSTGSNGQQFNGSSVAAAPPGIIGNIVSVLSPAGGGTDYVTTQGYVYSVGGANYYGATSGGAIGGTAGSKIVNAVARPTGGYTEINAAGQTYNFGPNQNYAPGGNAYTPKYGNA